MQYYRNITSVLFGIVGLTTNLALADVKVEQAPLGPDGDVVGFAISPHGQHAAVMVAKGSRFVVLLDGVEGPKIESILTGVYGSPAQLSSNYFVTVPVVFSDDGNHSAYFAKVGDEYILVEDGKELARGPFVPNGMSNMTVQQLLFSHGGKHLFYMNLDGGKYHVVVDGKPGPGTGIAQPLVTSPDGEHYAYTGFATSSLGNGIPQWAVVDGKQVPFIGMELQYTARDVLISRMSANGASVLVLNGKPSIKAAGIGPLWISPDGLKIATVVTPTNSAPTLLTVNGNIVQDATGLTVQNVYFSPDGKRYAAVCTTKTGSKFMIIDGKKGEVYQGIANVVTSSNMLHWMFVNGVAPQSMASLELPVPGFTADSSKFVYIATQGGRQFMLVENDESNGFRADLALVPMLSQVGHRIAVIGIASNGKQHIIVDGQEKEYRPPGMPGVLTRCYCLTFTPDGTRYAFIDGTHLVVDGQTLPGMIDGMNYVFSPDDKHIAYKGSDGGAICLFLDGKIIDKNPGVGQIGRILFSPDGQHIFTVTRKNLQSMGTKDSVLLSVDCEPAAHYMEDNLLGGPYGGNFEFSSDGVLAFIARTDGNLRRFHVTPSSEKNIGTLLASAKIPVDKP